MFFFKIPFATIVPATATGSTVPANNGAGNTLRDRICGRIFAAEDNQADTAVYPAAIGISTCSKYLTIDFVVA